MKRIFAILVAASILPLAACSQPVASEAPTPLCEKTDGPSSVEPVPVDIEVVFDPVVENGMAAMQAVGLTIGVQCAASPIYVKGYGMASLAPATPASADTVYEIGSVSKQFIAAELVTLASRGLLGFDEPAGTYVPWLPPAWRPVTLRHLMNHTSGLPDHYAIFRRDPDTPFDFDAIESAADLVKAFARLDDELIAPPGSTFHYSSSGYAVLTAIIEERTGSTAGDALDEALLRPLSLEHTAFCNPETPDLAAGYTIGRDGPVPGPEVPATFLSGGIGLCSTVGELIAWERALVDGRVVGEDGFAAMSTKGRLTDGTEVPYGLGLHLDRIGGRDAVFHEGGTAAFSSWLAYYAQHDLIVAIAVNTLGPNAARIEELVIGLTDAALAPPG